MSSGASVQAGMGQSCTGPRASVTRGQSMFIRVPWRQQRKMVCGLLFRTCRNGLSETVSSVGDTHAGATTSEGALQQHPGRGPQRKTEIALFTKPGSPQSTQMHLTVKTRRPRRTRRLSSPNSAQQPKEHGVAGAWGGSAGLASSLRFPKTSAVFFVLKSSAFWRRKCTSSRQLHPAQRCASTGLKSIFVLSVPYLSA